MCSVPTYTTRVCSIQVVMNASVEHDPLREIRSMVLASFPCPPLPQMVVREESGQYGMVSSHDTVATGMQASNRTFTEDQENARMVTQLQIQQQFNGTLDTLYETYKTASPVERLKIVDMAYETMQDFTRRIIATYMPKRLGAGGTECVDTPLPDARFMGIDDVCVGDAVHRHACEHLVALRIVVGETARMCDMDDIKDLSYRAVIARFFEYYCQDVDGPQENGSDCGSG